MLAIRKDLCLDFGFCIQSCPRHAISITLGHAEIDQSQCNQCRLCLDLCPRGAITELVLLSIFDLRTDVNRLKNQVEDIIARIDNLSDSIGKARQVEK